MEESMCDDIDIDSEPPEIQFTLHKAASERNKRKLTDNMGYTYNVKVGQCYKVNSTS